MLDGGPSRKLRTAERHAAVRPGSIHRQQEEAQQGVRQQPVYANAASRVTTPRQERPKRFMTFIVSFAILVILVVGGWAVWLATQATAAIPIERDKLQAVFMTGGQVYFGKLEILNNSYIKLSEVFYIQSGTASGDGENPQSTSEDSNMQLIKLGEEVHGPEDAMIINRDQVLFYENLKPAGKVSQLIQNYKTGKR